MAKFFQIKSQIESQCFKSNFASQIESPELFKSRFKLPITEPHCYHITIMKLSSACFYIVIILQDSWFQLNLPKNEKIEKMSINRRVITSKHHATNYSIFSCSIDSVFYFC